MTNRAGEELGKYRLVRLLGRGSFAEVYLGEHIYLKTEAAVKVVHTRLADSDVENFLNEARIIARLVHPHIIGIHDFDVQGGIPFLVMDYAPNDTLRHRHPRGTPVPLKTIVHYVKQVADALQYAHNQKLIHRDVKPENMLLGRRNEVLLSDFGIVQVVQSTLSEIEGAQKIEGTIAYMSPEQLQGKARFATDQYALGIVTYEWLSGDRPFQGSLSEIASQHIFAPPPPLREKVPTIPPAVEAVVVTALAKDPKQRFENIVAFANALEQAASLAPTSHAPTSPYAPPAPILFTTPPTLPAVNKPSRAQQMPPQQPAPAVMASPGIRPLSGQQPPPAVPSTSVSGAPVFTDPPTQVQAQLSAAAQPKTAFLLSPSKRKVILLIGLALLIVASGVGIFYIVANQIAINKVHATATATAQANATTTASIIAANATATASVIAANPNPYPSGGGTLALYDPLSSERIGSAWDKGAGCAFKGGTYYVSAINIRHLNYCTDRSSNFSNFAYEVQMKIIQGDVGGIIFRNNGTNNTYYVFFVAQNGYYSLFACTAKACSQLLINQFSSSIKQGLNQVNVLAVVAVGASIKLYVNHQQLASVTDSSYQLGRIGLVASPGPNTEDPTEVAYSMVKVWTL